MAAVAVAAVAVVVVVVAKVASSSWPTSRSRCNVSSAPTSSLFLHGSIPNLNYLQDTLFIVDSQMREQDLEKIFDRCRSYAAVLLSTSNLLLCSMWLMCVHAHACVFALTCFLAPGMDVCKM